MSKCQLKKRVDDIPKKKGEHSWHCESCGALLFSARKPACPRALFDNAKAQIEALRQQLPPET